MLLRCCESIRGRLFFLGSGRLERADSNGRVGSTSVERSRADGSICGGLTVGPYAARKSQSTLLYRSPTIAPIRMLRVRSTDEQSGLAAAHGSHRLVGYMLHISNQCYPLWMDRNPLRIDCRFDCDDIELSHGRCGPYARRHHIQSRIAYQIPADLCCARGTTRRLFAYKHFRQRGSIWGVTVTSGRSTPPRESSTIDRGETRFGNHREKRWERRANLYSSMLFGGTISRPSQFDWSRSLTMSAMKFEN